MVWCFVNLRPRFSQIQEILTLRGTCSRENPSSQVPSQEILGSQGCLAHKKSSLSGLGRGVRGLGFRKFGTTRTTQQTTAGRSTVPSDSDIKKFLVVLDDYHEILRFLARRLSRNLEVFGTANLCI